MFCNLSYHPFISGNKPMNTMGVFKIIYSDTRKK